MSKEYATAGRVDQLNRQIKQLQAFNSALKRRAKAAESDWQLAEVENKRLKAKARIIQVGNVPAPKFDLKGFNGIKKGMKFDLADPESAYLYGWESALFECGEILSKP